MQGSALDHLSTRHLQAWAYTSPKTIRQSILVLNGYYILLNHW